MNGDRIEARIKVIDKLLAVTPQGTRSYQSLVDEREYLEGWEARHRARETAAHTREEWEAMGRPERMPVRDSVPVSFRYPKGATSDEEWDFYRTKLEFLSSGHGWNDPEGRRLGLAHLDVVKRIQERVAGASA